MTLQLPFFFSNYNILLFRRIDVNYSFRRIDVNLIAILFDDTKISIFLFFGTFAKSKVMCRTIRL